MASIPPPPWEQPGKLAGLAKEIIPNLLPFPGAKILQTMGETPVPGVGPAAEYLGGKVTGLEETLMGAGERVGLPPALAAGGAMAVMLPSEMLVKTVEGASTAQGLALTLGAPFRPFRV